MKFTIIVLLLAAIVMATAWRWDGPSSGPPGHRPYYPKPTAESGGIGPECETGNDCAFMCNLHCFNSMDSLCVDGSCLCDVKPIDLSTIIQTGRP